MNSEQYREALAHARNIVKDPYNKEQVEEAQYKKAQLKSWWQQKAAEYLKAFEGVDVTERVRNWRSYTYDLDLDMFGDVIVMEYQEDEHSPRVLVDYWVLNKADIMQFVDMRESGQSSVVLEEVSKHLEDFKKSVLDGDNPSVTELTKKVVNAVVDSLNDNADSNQVSMAQVGEVVKT